jgi:hypothetical protein
MRENTWDGGQHQKRVFVFIICPKISGKNFPNYPKFLSMRMFLECPNFLGINEKFLQHL